MVFKLTRLKIFNDKFPTFKNIWNRIIKHRLVIDILSFSKWKASPRSSQETRDTFQKQFNLKYLIGIFFLLIKMILYFLFACFHNIQLWFKNKFQSFFSFFSVTVTDPFPITAHRYLTLLCNWAFLCVTELYWALFIVT